MATDFNNKSAMAKPLFVGSSLKNDLPLDIRTRIETINEMAKIEFPYIGMLIYVIDEDKFYIVKSLKGEELIPGISSTMIQNFRVDEYEEFSVSSSKNLVFNTRNEAENYARNDADAYHGQIIHIKDARTQAEKNNSVKVYEETCYIDYNKAVQTICSFTYTALGQLLDILYDINDGIDCTARIDELRTLILDAYTYDFDEYPN